VLYCLDVDECLRPGMCQHSCRNTWGSFQCLCDEGYQPAADGRSCDGYWVSLFLYTVQRFFCTPWGGKSPPEFRQLLSWKMFFHRFNPQSVARTRG